MRGIDHLTAAVDFVLVGNLPDALRAAIDAALAKGAKPAEVLRRVRAQAGRDSLIPAAVAAYMEGKRGEKA